MKEVITVVLLLVGSLSFSQKYQRANVSFNPEEILSVFPQTNLPLLDIKDSNGKIFKTIKAPSLQCNGFVSIDKKYVFVSNNENLYQIRISDNSTVSIPFKSMQDQVEGIFGTFIRMLTGFHTVNNKIYLLTISLNDQTAGNPIDIYEADFERKEVVKYMSFPKTTKNRSFGQSWHNKYFVVADDNYKVELYDVTTKKMIREIKIDVPYEKIASKPLTFIRPFIMNGELRISYGSENNSDAKNDWICHIEYDLVTNKKKSEVYREGEFTKAREVQTKDFEKIKDFLYLSILNELPPYPKAKTLSVFPDPERIFYKKPKSVEILAWISEYEANKKEVLELIDNNPDSCYNLSFYSKPSIMRYMKKEQLSYMEVQYENMLYLRDSLSGVFNEKRRLWQIEASDMSKRYYTVFYSDADCTIEAFRIEGNVVSAVYVETDIIEITGSGSGGVLRRKFNTKTKEFIETKVNDLDDF